MVDGEQLVLSTWAAQMITNQDTIVHLAQTIQHAKDMAHLGKQDMNTTVFPDGSYVLAKYHSTDGVVRHRGPPNKLLSILRGPLKVVSHVDDRYTIRSLITGRDEEIHVTELRAFIHATMATEDALRDIARRDHQNAFVIEAVLAHKGPRYARRLMEFLVRWEGYGPDADEWTPYSELRDTAPLHEYLFAQPQRGSHQMVPRKFFIDGVYSPEYTEDPAIQERRIV